MRRSSDTDAAQTGKGKWALLRACERGATAIEYGLIISLIVIAMMASLSTVAEKTINMWGNVSNEVTKH